MAAAAVVQVAAAAAAAAAALALSVLLNQEASIFLRHPSEATPLDQKGHFSCSFGRPREQEEAGRGLRYDSMG